MLTEDDVRHYYQQQGIEHAVRVELEEIRSSCPGRTVGRGALRNTIVHFQSKRNAAERLLESRTVEHLFALERELDSNTIAYWCQPPLKGIDRNGRISSATADFLVFGRAGIELIECKPAAKLRALCEANPDEWSAECGGFRRPPLERWASARGLRYRVFAGPEPFAHYLANLELLYDRKGHPDPMGGEARALGCLLRALKRESPTLQQALDRIEGLHGETVAWGLANGALHGSIASVPLNQPTRFRLFSDREHARQVDECTLAKLRKGLSHIDASDPLSRASPVDYRHAIRRLEKVEQFIRSGSPMSRHWRQLAKKVNQALAESASPLEACLTSYFLSGRRVAQLNGAQRSLLSEFVERYHRTNDFRSLIAAYTALDSSARARQIRPPSYQTFRLAARAIDPEARAMATGGRRSFQAARKAVDPRERASSAYAFGQAVHIDSTPLDQRCLWGLEQFGLHADRPVLYVAVDQATKKPLARALAFGHARRDFLALLMRDLVARHGFLPRYVIADGGTEYSSHWFKELCRATGMSRMRPPTGSPRSNSDAESLLGRVNAQVAHHLTGSTLPDRHGRSVDPAFKSYKTARHRFETVVDQVDQALFRDFCDAPLGVTVGSPEERQAELVALLGCSGIPTPFDDAFLLRTSIPISPVLKVDLRQGIRHLDRRYTSKELLAHAAAEKPLEMRRDCAHPGKLYVKYSERWLTAFAQDIAALESMSEAERTFEQIMRQHVASANRTRRQDVRRLRHDRIAQANASVAASAHSMIGRSPTEAVVDEVAERWFPEGTTFEPYGG